MIEESLVAPACRHPAICYSPDDDDGSGVPEYVPTSGPFVVGELEATAGAHTQGGDDIVFGPGVQLPADPQVADISDRVTRMDIDSTPRSGMMLEVDSHAAGFADVGEHITNDGSVEEGCGETATEAKGGEVVAESVRCATFCKAIFKDAVAPLLPRPATALPSGRGRKRPARPSPVPVSQRAQRKLMRELQFIDTPAMPPDSAVTEYIDMYGQDLPDQAIDTIRVAAQLGNKRLSMVLAAMAAEAGEAEMEVP